MTKQTLSATAEPTGIVVRIGGETVATIRDGKTIVARIDKAVQAAGFVRTGAFFPSTDLSLKTTLVADVAAIA